METLIIEAESDQIATLKAFLETMGIGYKVGQDATDYLLSNEANRNELLGSIKEAEEGKTKRIDLDDIWK